MENIQERMMDLRLKGYCCSQILMQMGLDQLGKENQDLIDASGGLCDGIYSGKTCGVLTAAVSLMYLADPEEVLVVVYDPAAEQQTVQLDKDIPVYARIGAESGETCPKGTDVSLLPIRGNAYYLFRGDDPVGIAYAEDLGVRVPEQDPGEESIGGPSNGGSLTPLWIALGACGAAAVFGVVLAVILKKRKKKT